MGMINIDEEDLLGMERCTKDSDSETRQRALLEKVDV